MASKLPRAAFTLALLLPGLALAQAYTFTPLAGTPSAGYADGSGSAALFSYPTAVATDAGGNVYVADVGNSVIRKITANGVVTTLAGQPGQRSQVDGIGAAAQFGYLQSIAADDLGNVYVVDNQTIRRVSSAGNVTTLAGAPGVSGSSDGRGEAARFGTFCHVVVDRSGILFVADGSNCTIRRITPDGVVTTLAGTAGVRGWKDGPAGAALFQFLGPLALDSAGNLFVWEWEGRLRKISPEGLVTTSNWGSIRPVVSSSFGDGIELSLRGLAIDLAGNVYASFADDFDYTNQGMILKVTPAGVATTFAGDAGQFGSADGIGRAAQFVYPGGLAMGKNGDLFIADTGNNTIRKITAEGVTTTLAGTPPGNLDGVGPAARFREPGSVALDAKGNVYVADNGNYAIRQIDPRGAVTTVGVGATQLSRFPQIATDLAGNLYTVDQYSRKLFKTTPDGAVNATPLDASPQSIAIDATGTIYVTTSTAVGKIAPNGAFILMAGQLGRYPASVFDSADGKGTEARFVNPAAIAVDGTGIVFVADNLNNTIRKITPDGVVTTLAGASGERGYVDGPGASARFSFPSGLAVDREGSLFVADRGNGRIRKIAGDGLVTTVKTTATGAGSPVALAIADSGTLYVTYSNHVVQKGVPESALALPVVLTPPRSLVARPGSMVVCDVGASGAGLSYQWKKDEVPLAGATDATLVFTRFGPENAGRYTCTISNVAGAVTTPAATLALGPSGAPGHLINASVRAFAGPGGRAAVFGLRIGDSGPTAEKPLLLRAVGPTLIGFGIAPALPDPSVQIYAASTGAMIEWPGSAGLEPQARSVAAALGAFPLSPSSQDVALYGHWRSGTYALRVAGAQQTAGITLIEAYDASILEPSGGMSLSDINHISGRGEINALSDHLAAGFIVAGATARTFLIRAAGPALASLGVTDALSDPVLEIFAADSPRTVIRSNDDWGGDLHLRTATAAVGAFPFAERSRDAALLVTLPAGSYTARISGLSQATGTVLLEMFALP